MEEDDSFDKIMKEQEDMKKMIRNMRFRKMYTRKPNKFQLLLASLPAIQQQKAQKQIINNK